MSVFKPAPKHDPKDASLVNVAVTVRANTPGLPSSQKEGSEKTDHSTGLRNLWAGSDFHQYKELDPQTLEPIGTVSQKILHPSLKGPLSGAHAQFDPETGDVFNYNLELGMSATYRVFKTSAATGEIEILATIKGKGVKAAYIHSFFLTRDYVILCIWSAWYGGNGMKILSEQNCLDAISAFDPSRLTRWFVVDRRYGIGLVAEFESPAAFCFHTVNAWQEVNSDGSTDLLCELVEFENLDILHKFYYENLTSTGKNTVAFNAEKGGTSIPRLVRYRLSHIVPKTIKPSSNILNASLELSIPKLHIGELPTINPLFATRASRYIYSVVNRGYSSFVDGISKVDTHTGEVLYWDEREHTPGEAVFVPDPEGREEDDGVLLSVVLDGGRGESYLLCLDARTLKEVGRAKVGCVVGFGFHGVHVKG
jgi:torulene dioxygenase